MSASNDQLALAEKSLQISKDASVQKLEVSNDFSRFILPIRMMVVGPTLSGKSEFILNLLKYRDLLFNEPLERVVYCVPARSSEVHYSYIERLTKVYEDLEVIEGLPKVLRDDLAEGNGQKMIILDDMVNDIVISKEMHDIFTIHSHHNKLSVSKLLV